MKYLVLEGIKDLEEVLNEMSENINNQKQTSLYKQDFNQIKTLSEYFINGDLDYCNMLTDGFETAVRETIPKSVWELLGNKLLHEKDRKLKQDNLGEVRDNVKEILLAYKNKNYKESEKLEIEFSNNFAKEHKIKDKNNTKDELLIECLIKIQESDDEESKALVKKIKNSVF